MDFRGRAYLLDIEGTVSSVRFVTDVMFAFVRREVEAYLQREWNTPAVQAAIEQIARDQGKSVAELWGEHASPEELRRRIREHVLQLMDQDSKSTGLKQLQGLIWEAGFHSGELKADVFPDVPAALERWTTAGKDVRIYSSGSVQAQKLFFGHTVQGNLLPYFKGFYDTRVGGKKFAASYEAIVQDIGLPAGEILFLSDIVAELDAARAAGLRTGLVVRPGNAPTADANGHPILETFAGL